MQQPVSSSRHSIPEMDAEQPSSSDGGWAEMVMQGRRLIVYPYVFSIVAITFCRTMGDAQIVETGKWPMGPLIRSALITTTFGWLGVPFGIIFSFINVFYLWKGGRDLTKRILIASVGKKEAKRILSIAPKPEPPALIWLVRVISLIPLLAIAGGVTYIVMTNGKL